MNNELKIGDIVEIIELYECDKECGLEVGTRGKIVGESCMNISDRIEFKDIFYVKFDCEIFGEPTDLNSDGSYQMYRYELRKVEDDLTEIKDEANSSFMKIDTMAYIKSHVIDTVEFYLSEYKLKSSEVYLIMNSDTFFILCDEDGNNFAGYKIACDENLKYGEVVVTRG